jgi:DnaJ-domain-containing protein 1
MMSLIAHKPRQKDAVDRADTSPAWHDVLNVPPHATVDEIRTAYKTLMSQYHPDKVASLGDELRTLAERKSKEITSACRQAMQSHGTDAEGSCCRCSATPCGFLTGEVK